MEDQVKKFQEEWERASKLSPNLVWAIFPVGDKEIEVQAVRALMGLFENIDVLVHAKEDALITESDMTAVITELELSLASLKAQRSARFEKTLASANDEYVIRKGV